MFEVKIDYSDFEKLARNLVGAQDQVAFALADSLNRAVENTRQVLIRQTWPRSVDARNSGFIRAALLRGPRATKTDLRVSIYDALGRANLKQHADSGTKLPKQTARLAIPVEANVRRTASGVTASQRPMNLANSFVADRTGRGLAIYQRQGRRLKLMYVLRQSAPIRSDVPFRSDFEDTMRAEARANFPAAMMRALLTSNRT
jgi:hypothetical protein